MPFAVHVYNIRQQFLSIDRLRYKIMLFYLNGYSGNNHPLGTSYTYIWKVLQVWYL